MRRTIMTIFTIATAMALGAPSALATWNALGSFEPDTPLDVTGGYMFINPNVDKIERMYLNVVPMQRDTEINPNVALVQSRILVPGNLGFDAFFGTWIDCNLDGYVGHIETMLIEYPSQLLPANTPCTSSGQKDKYNAQGWVSEMRWIRNPFATPQSYAGFDDDGDGIPEGRDGRSIQDLGASVWGDFGVPGDTGGREVCPRTPTNGAAQRTGAGLNWADCFTRHQLWDVANGGATVLGMPYSEQDNFDQEGHALNVETLGEGGRNNTMATFFAYDCSEPPEPEKIETGQSNVGTTPHQNATVQNQQYTVPWATVTDEKGELNVSVWSASYYSGEYRVERQLSWDPSVPRVNLPSPSPSVRPGGTVAGTYSEGLGGCDEEGGNVYGFVESSTPAQDGTKRSVNLRFTYYEEQRNGIQQGGMPFYGAFLYPFMRSGFVPLVNGNQWYSQSTAPSELGTAGPTPPQLVRTSDLQPEGAIYWTFYANLTLESLSKVVIATSSPGTYGSEWCARSNDPKINGGFDCDPRKWYLDAAGERIDGTEFHPGPGHAFHLRDVDCYDGTVMARDPVTGSDTSIVKASLAMFSTEGPCP